MRLKHILMAALCLALSASWRIGAAMADDLNEDIIPEITEEAYDADDQELEEPNAWVKVVPSAAS